jgi:hypothetical protein
MRRPRRSAQRQNTQSDFLPAPMRGVNAVVGLASMTPMDAVMSFNMIPAGDGLRVRTGYREWVTDIPGGEVRTLIPLRGEVSDFTDDKLFAVTEDGIYDCSQSTDAPPEVVEFVEPVGPAGWGQYTQYTTIGGRFLLYTDEEFGYYVYDIVDDTWEKIVEGSASTAIDGTDPSRFVSVLSWKSRLWFVERNSTRAWYLPAGQILGTVTQFDFGSRFTRGGHLVNLYSFSTDGGDGIDDYLVALSSTGDVVVFQGIDPDDASSFQMVGIWNIGDLPEGRRIGAAFGGELYLLSVFGVLPLSALLAGRDIADEEIYITRQITPVINRDMRNLWRQRGWEMTTFPSDNLFIVGSPLAVGQEPRQYVQNLVTRGWGFYRNVPYITGAVWQRNFYFGTSDGRVMLHTGGLDNVSRDGEVSSNIEWAVLTSYQGGEMPSYNKRVQIIRPTFTSSLKPAYATAARYDFDMGPILETPPTIGLGDDRWDFAIWDLNVWGGGQQVADRRIGALGMGRHVAVWIRGNSAVETTLIGFDIMYDVGGLL